MQVTDVGAEPITLEEAKAHLREVYNDEDAYITGLITAARMMLEGRINRAIVLKQVSFTAPHFAHGMQLPLAPYVDQLAAEYTNAAGETVALADGEFVVHPGEPAVLYPATGAYFPVLTSWPGTVRISYRAGYLTPADVPAPLKQWMLLAIGTMYAHRENVVAGVSVAELPDSFMQMLWQPYMVYA